MNIKKEEMTFKTYQEALEFVGSPNATKKSQGIYCGRREYVFDDEMKKLHISLFKKKGVWSVGVIKRYYGRTGYGPAGFDL